MTKLTRVINTASSITGAAAVGALDGTLHRGRTAIVTIGCSAETEPVPYHSDSWRCCTHHRGWGRRSRRSTIKHVMRVSSCK